MRARARSQVYPRSADDIELPIDCPGTAPAPTPAVSHTVTATVGLTGLDCSEYTETEEAILVTALAMTLMLPEQPADDERGAAWLACMSLWAPRTHITCVHSSGR